MNKCSWRSESKRVVTVMAYGKFWVENSYGCAIDEGEYAVGLRSVLTRAA